jgi:hypothetical protein
MRTAAKHAVSTSWMISDRKSRSPKTDNNPEPGHGNDLSHAGTKFHCRLTEAISRRPFPGVTIAQLHRS